MLHAEGMPQVKHKRYFQSHDVSTTHKDLTDEKYRNLRRPKKVTFYCNGDRYFKGKVLFITPHRYLSFQDLLGDLTGKLPSSSSLPYGVRQIYTPRGGRRVRDIEDLKDGDEYVCAGFETFKSLGYGTTNIDPWGIGRPHKHNEPAPIDLKGTAYPHHAALPGLTPRGDQQARKPRQGPNDPYILRKDEGKYGTITKPKVITVVRAGRKPYANIKILLNRRSVQSYERLLMDISESFGPKWRNNKVRSLYTLTGREILSVSDFFRGDSVFVAVGNEKISFTDVQEIIETLYPDSPYAKSLLRNIEKQKRKAKQHMLQSMANDNQEMSDKVKPPAGQKGVKPSSKSNEQADGDAIQKKRTRPRAPKPTKQDEENRENLTPEPKEPQGGDTTGDSENEKPKLAKKPSRRRQSLASTELQDASKTDKEPEKKHEPIIEEEVPAQAPALAQKSRRKLREEKRKEQERQLQEKRAAEDKAKVNTYRDMEKAMNKQKEDMESETKKTEDDIEKKDGEKENRKKDENEKNIKELESREKEAKEKEAKEKEIKEKEGKEQEKRNEKERPKLRQAKSKAERLTEIQSIKEKYDIGRTLGDGNFALVKMCQHRDTGHQYAMKVIDKAKLKGKEHMIDNEIAIMKACQQENLVQLYDEFETSDEIYIVMELVKGGDLFDAITQSVKFTEPVAAKMATDMTNALFYLHSRGIVHRDLKPENLMVMRNKDESMTLKLGDFGLAVEVKSPIFTICGTPTYVAPEILSEIGYGLEVDMWAIGVITYILLCGFPPFRSPDRNQTELFEFIKAGHYEFLAPYWDNVSADAKDLIRRLLIVDKQTRYTAVDVLVHQWIVTVGGSKELPDNFPEYQEKLRADILEIGKANLAEWRANRAYVFANRDSSVSNI